jgi:predicted transposase YbfD/YdcC
VVKVRRSSQCCKDGKPARRGVRTFITSLSVEQIGDGRRLLEHIRAHWGIENKNHWKRDANWREDQPRLRNAALGRLLALLRGALLGKIKGNAKAAFAFNARHPRNAFNIINRRSI